MYIVKNLEIDKTVKFEIKEFELDYKSSHRYIRRQIRLSTRKLKEQIE